VLPVVVGALAVVVHFGSAALGWCIGFSSLNIVAYFHSQTKLNWPAECLALTSNSSHKKLATSATEGAGLHCMRNRSH
jgi:hypothetical protein